MSENNTNSREVIVFVKYCAIIILNYQTETCCVCTILYKSSIFFSSNFEK